MIAVALSAIISTVAEAKQPKYSADVPKSVTTLDVVETEKLGTLEFFDGMLSKETVKKVYDDLDFLRGVEAFLNAFAAASIYLMLEGVKDAGLKPGDLARCGRATDSFLSGA